VTMRPPLALAAFSASALWRKMCPFGMHLFAGVFHDPIERQGRVLAQTLQRFIVKSPTSRTFVTTKQLLGGKMQTRCGRRPRPQLARNMAR